MTAARLFAFVLAVIVLPLHALELRVLSAGAVEPGIRPALAAFERESGDTVRLEFAAAPALRAALRAPTPAGDVVIVPQGALDELAASGAAPGGPLAPIGAVGVGVAVRSGVAPPDISSPERLKAAIVAADTIVFNRASTGVHVEKVLQQLGIAAAVETKSERFPDGASVMRRLLAGTGPRELGFGATTEIALFAGQGLEFVGPLPASLQNHTRYVALPWPGVVPTDAPRAAAIAQLMRSLQGPAARSLFVNAGIAPTP